MTTSAGAGDPAGAAASTAPTRVAILADDLIWSTRLAGLVRGSGATPVAIRSAAGLEEALEAGVSHAIVDLTARAYDPATAIATAARAGATVLAIGPHDDIDVRKGALAAGAGRVLAYRKLADDGPATVAAWLSGAMPARSVAAGRP